MPRKCGKVKIFNNYDKKIKNGQEQVIFVERLLTFSSENSAFTAIHKKFYSCSE